VTGLDVDAVVRRGGFRLDVRFAVAPGEVLGVLGPNGAGKSTLLRALAGLTELSEGQLTLDGIALDDVEAATFVPPERRPVGLLFQNYRLFPHLSVRDNVAYGPRRRGAGRAAARATAAEWLTRLGLAELADRKPAQLSGGQAQRAALARALATDPALLLLDEPLAALDAETRLSVRAQLRRHLADFGGPTLLVTHDPLEAMVMCSRLLVLEGGRIVQQGSPGEVARRPATRYVAKLVGLNLYAGTAAAGSGAVSLDGGGTLVAAAAPVAGRVLVALSPTAVALHSTEPRDSSFRNVWRGVVQGMELLTDRVRVSVAGHPEALVDITAAAVAELGLAEGTQVWLTAKATELDVYPYPG
jgi:molybdate transport system ATP-binding protein